MGNNKDIERISHTHDEVHEGNTYQVWLTDDTMGDNDEINFAFKTPAATTKYIHLRVDWTMKAGGTLDVIEAPTWTAKSGTIFVPINVNRNSANTSSITGNETTTTFTPNEVAFNVTTILTTNATIIDNQGLFGTATKGGAVRGTLELILKAATKYVILLTADGASNAGHLHLRWYETLPNVI